MKEEKLPESIHELGSLMSTTMTRMMRNLMVDADNEAEKFTILQIFHQIVSNYTGALEEGMLAMIDGKGTGITRKKIVEQFTKCRNQGKTDFPEMMKRWAVTTTNPDLDDLEAGLASGELNDPLALAGFIFSDIQTTIGQTALLTKLMNNTTLETMQHAISVALLGVLELQEEAFKLNLKDPDKRHVLEAKDMIQKFTDECPVHGHDKPHIHY